MPSTILTNWTVYYADDVGSGGYKQLRWTGTTGTNTLNELYSALMDLFDASSQNDYFDSIPMKAITPTLYEIGSFDAGDLQPWFIDPESIKHLTGGGINTTRWTRGLPGDGTGAIGIVTFDYTVGGGTDFISSDIGKTITHSVGGDSGTLLFFESDGSNGAAWVRPDSNGSGDDWNSTGTNVSVPTGTGSGLSQDAPATTGENVWSNLFTLGTIESNTTVYIAQNNSVIDNSELSGSGSWWSAGHLDVLIPTTDQGTLIDRGLLTVYARQYSKRYSYYIADASAGGRIPVPLSTSDDPNNETGYKQMVLSVTNDAFAVGDLIEDDSDSSIQGVVTSYEASTNTLQYYLVGSLTDFSAATGTFASVSPGTGTGTAVNSTDIGPATTSLTITFGLDQSLDIDNDTTNEDYSIVIDLATSVTLEDMNERLKYITRRGSVTSLDGIEGQQYIGLDYRVDYTTITGSIGEGSTITQTLSDSTIATSEVVAHNTTDDYLMLRDTRGTLETGGSAAYLGIDGSNNITMTSATATRISPAIEHPFGLFAGGKFFGARGVALANVPAADATNYQVTDNDGNIINPPNVVPIVVTGVVQNTQCYIADSVPNIYLNTTATSNVAGDQFQASTTLTYSSDIAVTVRAREMGYLPFQTAGTITNSGLSVTAVWQIDPNFKFVVSGETIQFTNATSLITRGTGDFGTDGWLAVMSKVTVEGSTSNNGTYTITAVGTTTVTISGTLIDEGPVSGVTLTYTRREPTW